MSQQRVQETIDQSQFVTAGLYRSSRRFFRLMRARHTKVVVMTGRYSQVKADSITKTWTAVV